MTRMLIALVGMTCLGSSLPPSPLPDYSDLPSGTLEMVPPDALEIAIQNAPQYEVGEANGLIYYVDLLPHVVIFSPVGGTEPYLATGVDPPCEWGCAPIEPPRHRKSEVPEPTHYGYLVALAGGVIWISKRRRL